MKKRVLVSSVLIVLALAVVAIARQLMHTGPAAGETAVVRRGDLSASVTALGQVQPRHSVSLSLRVSGTVAQVDVQPGDTVVKGDKLLSLESWEYEQAVLQAERVLDLAQRQLALARQAPSSAELKIASARLRRATVARQHARQVYDDLGDDPDAETSDEALDLEIAKLEYELAQAELDRVLEGSDQITIARLEQELAQAEAALAQAQRRLESTVLTTPMDGTVLRLPISVGENLSAFNAAAIVADLTQLEIQAEIDEIDIAQVYEGQSVMVRLDALPGEGWQGEVAQVLPGISDSRGTTTYRAIIALDALPEAVRPGMGATLEITTRSVQDVLLIPREAVQQAGRHQYVQLLAGGQIHQVVVTTDLTDGTSIQVLEGLEEGQIVLIK